MYKNNKNHHKATLGIKFMKLLLTNSLGTAEEFRT